MKIPAEAGDEERNNEEVDDDDGLPGFSEFSGILSLYKCPIGGLISVVIMFLPSMSLLFDNCDSTQVDAKCNGGG
jgi:hypothetical protein